jgi:hypothetical protein
LKDKVAIMGDNETVKLLVPMASRPRPLTALALMFAGVTHQSLVFLENFQRW